MGWGERAELAQVAQVLASGATSTMFILRSMAVLSEEPPAGRSRSGEVEHSLGPSPGWLGGGLRGDSAACCCLLPLVNGGNRAMQLVRWAEHRIALVVGARDRPAGRLKSNGIRKRVHES